MESPLLDRPSGRTPNNVITLNVSSPNHQSTRGETLSGSFVTTEFFYPLQLGEKTLRASKQQDGWVVGTKRDDVFFITATEGSRHVVSIHVPNKFEPWG